MLLVDDASDVARPRDEYVARREVRVTYGRYVQVLCFSNKVRNDLQIVQQMIHLHLWINPLTAIKFLVERFTGISLLAESPEPHELPLTDCSQQLLSTLP
jgi:hypothetical protein